MYNPGQFRVDAPGRLHALMREHPLATLVVHGPEGLEAAHLPLQLQEVDGGAVLRGHVARANPLWRTIGAGCPALAVFHGPQAYVSPGWYPSKRVDGRVVPTWNYAVVHAHGTLSAVDDPAWLEAQVRALTDAHEAEREAPWSVDDAPGDYVARMLQGIVGIELAVARLEGKWKMSQNRSADDRAGVVAGLRAGRDPGGADVADCVAGGRGAPRNG